MTRPMVRRGVPPLAAGIVLLLSCPLIDATTGPVRLAVAVVAIVAAYGLFFFSFGPGRGFNDRD